MGKLLKKEDLNKFLYKIKTKHELIAPVMSDAVRFEIVKFISQIELEKIPDFPPKKYFIPQKDILFNFKDSKISSAVGQKKRIIFGIRLCDINAIHALDKLFFNKDSLYDERREKTILIGIKCSKEIEKNCFCTSFNLKNYADLYFHDMGESYFVEIGTDKGLRLVSRLKDYEYQIEPIITKKRLNKKDLIMHDNNKAWENAAKNCISCGACTIVCPTCLCYHEHDELNIKNDEGSRIRKWVSCQHNNFWHESKKESQNELENVSRKDKLKHRIYHKLDYFKKKHGADFCTGCGRCITRCPSKIDFVKIVNKLS